MVSKITLEIDREFLDGYRSYKIDEILKDDNVSKVTYSILSDFIDKSTYSINRLYEEFTEDVDTLKLIFEDLTIKRNYRPDMPTFLDELFEI